MNLPYLGDVDIISRVRVRISSCLQQIDRDFPELWSQMQQSFFEECQKSAKIITPWNRTGKTNIEWLMQKLGTTDLTENTAWNGRLFVFLL